MIERTLLTCFIMLAFFAVLQGQTPDTTIINKSEIFKKSGPDSARVYVAFTVEKSGRVTDVKVKKTECYNCTRKFEKSIKKEAVRVVKGMPAWKPRKEKTKYLLPIKIRIKD